MYASGYMASLKQHTGGGGGSRPEDGTIYIYMSCISQGFQKLKDSFELVEQGQVDEEVLKARSSERLACLERTCPARTSCAP